MGAEDADRRSFAIRNSAIQPFLDQDAEWPSESKGVMAIGNMDPAHAFNAWRELKSLYRSSWKSYAVRALPIALMRRFLDDTEGVMFVTPGTVYTAPDMAAHTITTLDEDVALEVVFDALEIMDAENAKRRLANAVVLHPIERARIVLAAITNPAEREKA